MCDVSDVIYNTTIQKLYKLFYFLIFNITSVSSSKSESAEKMILISNPSEKI